MHLDIGLPLLSELEQLRRGFWQNHNHQAPSQIQDHTPDSHEETHCTQQQSPDPKQRLDNSNEATEPNSTPAGHSDGQQQQPNNHDTRTENSHSCLNTECTNDSQHKSQHCRSLNTDSGKNGSETCENTVPSGQEKVQHQRSQPLHVNSSLLGKSNRLRRTSKVLWDKSTEDSSFL